MVRLKKHKCSNVVYNLAKGVGEERSGVDESRLPVSRMPMGLIEHITNFFTAEDMNEVRLLFIYAVTLCSLLVPTCPSDYRSWL